MAVIHILKDGSIVKDITNHVVRVVEARALYELIANINRDRSKKRRFKK